jgi:glycerophosphoryl diester phosphodiesterase
MYKFKVIEADLEGLSRIIFSVLLRDLWKAGKKL